MRLRKFSGATAAGSDSFLEDAISVPRAVLRVSPWGLPGGLAFLQSVLKQWGSGVASSSTRVALPDFSRFALWKDSSDPTESSELRKAKAMYGPCDPATGRGSPPENGWTLWSADFAEFHLIWITEAPGPLAREVVPVSY